MHQNEAIAVNFRRPCRTLWTCDSLISFEKDYLVYKLYFGKMLLQISSKPLWQIPFSQFLSRDLSPNALEHYHLWRYRPDFRRKSEIPAPLSKNLKGSDFNKKRCISSEIRAHSMSRCQSNNSNNPIRSSANCIEVLLNP